MSAPALTALTLTDGGQTAEAIAERLVAWLEARAALARPGALRRAAARAVGDAVAGALRGAAGARRAGADRLQREDGPERAPRPLPPPPRTEPSLLDALGVPLRAIPGEPDLMHHKFVVRDGTAVWTGSTNWTLDSWTREENVLLTVDSPELARAYARVFGELWDRGHVEGTGGFDTMPIALGDGTSVRPWFCPGAAPELAAPLGAAHRGGAPARAHRLARPDGGAGPGDAQRGRSRSIAST